MFIRLPVDAHGNTLTIAVDHIAYIGRAPKYRGPGTLIHLGVRVLQYERRMKLAVVYTTLPKDRVDALIAGAGASIQDYKPGHMYGRGNY